MGAEMNYSTLEIWGIILALGAGTMLIRYSFLGFLGGRDMPPWVLRHLRYTPVAVLPGLVMPILVWHGNDNGDVDPIRLVAGAAALGFGYWSRNIVWGMIAGALVLTGLRLISA